MNPTLLVLAAGMGSRYGGLKQIDPVGPSGETIIDYSIYDSIRAGFGKLVFVIRRDIEADFKESIGKKYEDKIDIDYAFQELTMVPEGFSVPEQRRKPWGTGHAVLTAEEVINEPFAVINADDFYGAHSFRVLADYLKTAQDGERVANYAMVGFVLRNTLSEFGTVARGVCHTNADGFLENVVETTNIAKDGDRATYTDDEGTVQQLSGDEIVSMNMWGFTPSIFDHLRQQFADFVQERGGEEKAEFYIPTVVNNLISQDVARVTVLSSQDSWFGVTYREDKPYVVDSIKSLVENDVYPEALWA